MKITILDLSTNNIVYTTSLEFIIEKKTPTLPLVVLGVIVIAAIVTIVWKFKREHSATQPHH